jgi:uncharacterized membrane protein YdjX (TVP38/TMEM64 family)
VNEQATPAGAKKTAEETPALLRSNQGLTHDLKLLARGASRPLLAVGLIVAIILLLRPAEWVDRLDLMRDWVQAQGLLGLLAVLGIYVVAAVALVPQTVLKVAAGGLFGSAMGVVVASLGSTLGGLACFLIARYVARGSWMRRLKSGPRMTQLDEMSREKGTMLVVICRLLPIFPGNVLNYALGLTQLRTFTFAFWSWLAMLPGIVVLVVGTDAILRGIAEGRVPWGLVGIVIAMLVLLVVTTFLLRRRFPWRE